ncbi:histidine kinase dimerization/phosphoacceptor domain -containing protein [uncultured Devosia sp.]|uniref:histidine kinase dimerization/phosphoacceptor domain -containing protein n=1 Tax=uncultured Devosia sp. TaxID=211434 RepID=UPI0035C99255
MPNGTPRVLYIDDDPGLARLVQRTMERRGYEFEHAATGEAGLSRIAAGGIDVVALDHYLPTGTGLDVLAAMTNAPDRPAVVYVTGSAETAIAVAALKSGATDYVSKSLDAEFMELLASAIDHAIERVRLNRARLRAEAEVREARDRAEILLGEVNHRVANSLAMVAALVGLQTNAVQSREAKDALVETQARISAIAGVHRHLYTSDDVRTVQIADYLESLAGELDTSMKAAGHHSPIKIDVMSFPIATEKAASLGVIVTELVTNAMKYAYRDTARGEVRIRLSQTSQGVELRVEDDGVGWDGTGTPQGTGLGSRIVKAMAQSLGATIAYGQGSGTSVSLQFPG